MAPFQKPEGVLNGIVCINVMVVLNVMRGPFVYPICRYDLDNLSKVMKSMWKDSESGTRASQRDHDAVD